MLSAASRVKLWELVQCVSGYTLSHHPAKCAVRLALVAPGGPGVACCAWLKEPQGLITTGLKKDLVSAKFNMTFIYLLVEILLAKVG